MNSIRKVFAWFVALTMSLSMLVSGLPAAVFAEETTAQDCIKELIVYYRDYQEAASTDIDRTLEKLRSIDETQYEVWSQIMDYWSYINTDMQVNIGTVPEGLPEDSSMCVVILGFALNSDGSMKPELIGRLQTGLAIAQTYPNCYVAVTGGGTASGNPNVTEGGLMGEWLLEQGLDESRLIIENKAPNTVGNAENTYRILAEQYPSVDSLVMVTSDYHVPRGCILFYSKCLLTAYATGQEPLQVISNAGFETGSQGYESISLQANGVASVAGVSLSGVSVELSSLAGLKASVKPESVGQESLQVNASAVYDSGWQKDVSGAVEISGYDPASGFDQSVTISYTENGVTISGTLPLDGSQAEIAGTSMLEELVAEAEAIDLRLYQGSSFAALQKAIEEAKAVLAGQPTIQEVADATAALRNAMNGLKAKGNLAAGMSVTANCNQSAASKITDGTVSLNNYWASTNDQGNVAAADASFVIDMERSIEADAIRVYPYWNGNRVYKYELSGSDDQETWTKLSEKTGDDVATVDGDLHVLSEGTSFRYLKLQGISTSVPNRPDINNIHIVEVKVYGNDAANLALGRPVTSSGTDTSAASSASSKDAQINDGDRTTYWDAGKYAERPWAVVDLEKECWIDAVNVITYWMRTDKRYYYYEVETSLDGKNFTPLYAKTEGTDASTSKGERHDLEAPVLARYVKLTGTYDSANSSFHLNELQVFGHVKTEKRLLAQAIEYAEGITLPEHLNALVAQNFETALSQAKAVNDDMDASQEEINEAWKNLVQAIQMLDFTSDFTELNALIERTKLISVDTLQEGAEKEEFLAALDYAKTVAADPAALDDGSIQSAVNRLQAAMDALVYVEFDDSMLRLLVKTIESLNLDDYIDSGKAELSAALEQAKAVLEHAQSQEEIDAAAADLHQAWLAMRLKPDEALLRALQDLEVQVVSLLECGEYPIWNDQLIVMKTALHTAVHNENLSVPEAEKLRDEAEALVKSVTESEKQKPAVPEEKPKTEQEEKPAAEPRKDLAQKDSGASEKKAESVKASVKTASFTEAGFWLGTVLGAALLGVLSIRKQQ